MNKLKVLWCGHYREESGWGRANREYIKSLLTVGVDVVCRPVILGNKAKLPDWLLECEDKEAKDCEIVFQHTLPNYYVYSGSFKKNIGLVATETDSLGVSGWNEYINLLDEVIVFCDDSKKALEKSHVNIPIYVVGHATDIEKYKTPRRKLDLGPDFKFLGVGEWNPRKNWGALIRAFHSQFDPSENVSLVLKVNSSHLSQQELARDVNNTINKIKMDLRKFKNLHDYKPDTIITEFLTEEEILDLYSSCDCYCSSSHGEAVNYGCLDAVGFGMYPVVTNCGGMKDIVAHHSVGPTVSCQDSPVTGIPNMIDGLFTANENWKSVNITEFGEMMRIAYVNLSDSKINGYIKQNSNKRIKDFSYQNIGNEFLEIINA